MLDWRIAARRAATIAEGTRTGMTGVFGLHYWNAFAYSAGEAEARCTLHVHELESRRHKQAQFRNPWGGE